MKYVIHVLKKKLQSEKHCAQVHSKLAADKRFAISAKLAQERIPQLEKAIEILSNIQSMPESAGHTPNTLQDARY